MNSWHSKANELFIQALQLPTDTERGEFLDRECGDDPRLRETVKYLLDAHAKAGSFLELDRTIDVDPAPMEAGLSATFASDPRSSSVTPTTAS